MRPRSKITLGMIFIALVVLTSPPVHAQITDPTTVDPSTIAIAPPPPVALDPTPQAGTDQVVVPPTGASPSATPGSGSTSGAATSDGAGTPRRGNADEEGDWFGAVLVRAALRFFMSVPLYFLQGGLGAIQEVSDSPLPMTRVLPEITFENPTITSLMPAILILVVFVLIMLWFYILFRELIRVSEMRRPEGESFGSSAVNLGVTFLTSLLSFQVAVTFLMIIDWCCMVITGGLTFYQLMMTVSTNLEDYNIVTIYFALQLVLFFMLPLTLLFVGFFVLVITHLPLIPLFVANWALPQTRPLATRGIGNLFWGGIGLLAVLTILRLNQGISQAFITQSTAVNFVQLAINAVLTGVAIGAAYYTWIHRPFVQINRFWRFGNQTGPAFSFPFAPLANFGWRSIQRSLPG